MLPVCRIEVNFQIPDLTHEDFKACPAFAADRQSNLN
jgi:hypothetical protein